MRKEGLKSTLHKDSTVTYWSIYEQVWCERVQWIPDNELAAMSEPERTKVRKHLEGKEEK